MENSTILDSIASSNFKRVKSTIMTLLNKMQSERPDVLVTAIGALFIIVCRRYDVPARRVLEYTDRIIVDADRKFPHEIGAVNDFMRDEL